jgi:short-subunit dehydrogenase
MALPDVDPTSTTLITGASSGLGAEFARQFAAAGRNVTLVARREDRLRELADELSAAHGVRADVLAADLTDPDARTQLEQRVRGLGLRVDVLVSNAGFATGGRFVQSPVEQELDQVRLLCEAPVHLARIFLPEMLERKSGAILFVASTAGLVPLPYSTTYAAAKAHALAFAEGLHGEIKARGVTVTALCPGPVHTELFEKEDHPVERLPEPFWVDQDRVVAAGIDGLARGKRVVVPGLLIRAGAPVGRLAPRWLTNRVVERVFRS